CSAARVLATVFRSHSCSASVTVRAAVRLSNDAVIFAFNHPFFGPEELVSVQLVGDDGVVGFGSRTGTMDESGIVAAAGTGFDAGGAERLGAGLVGTIEMRPL